MVFCDRGPILSVYFTPLESSGQVDMFENAIYLKRSYCKLGEFC